MSDIDDPHLRIGQRLREAFDGIPTPGDRIAALEAENARLREALQPFAQAPEPQGGALICYRTLAYGIEGPFTKGTIQTNTELTTTDFLRARAALATTQERK